MHIRDYPVNNEFIHREIQQNSKGGVYKPYISLNYKSPLRYTIDEFRFDGYVVDLYILLTKFIHFIDKIYFIYIIK